MRAVAAPSCGALAALAAALLASSALAAPEGSPPSQRALLEVTIDGESRGVWQARLEGRLQGRLDGGLDGRDLWLPLRELESSGVKLPPGARRAGSPPNVLVSLRSLGSGATFSVDLELLQASVDFSRELLGRRVLDLAVALRPEGLEVRSDLSAFANYAVEVASPGTLSATTEAGLSLQGWVLSTQTSRPAAGGLARGLTALTVDDPSRLLRWTLGDAFSGGDVPGGLWGGALLGGASVQRDRSLDPYRVYAPLPSQRGFAATPSTMDVYVNGALVRSLAVAPGSFDLQNLPVPAGTSNVRTVLRDAFGRTQELSTRPYFSAGLLARGYTDWAASAGWKREQFGLDSFSYGPLAALGSVRRGLATWLTGGARVEAAGGGLFNLGGSLTAAPSLAWFPGEVELAGAVSRDGGPRGAALSFAWSVQSALVGAGFLVRLQGPRYANVSLPSATDRALWLVSGTAAVPLGKRISLALDLSAQEQRDAGRSAAATLRTQVTLGAGLSANAAVGAAHSPNAPGPGLSASLGLIWVLNPLVSFDALAGRQADGTRSASVGAQQSLQAGPGYGYRTRVGVDDSVSTISLLAQAQGRHGRVEAGLETTGALANARASVTGGMVAMGGALFLTRPLEQGWALLRLPGIEGVRGLLENQEVGRTDGRGDLLVPGLRPYYANRLALVPTDVPMDQDLGPVERLVSLPTRGGALVNFRAARVAAVSGSLFVARPGLPPVAPAFGELLLSPPGNGQGSPPGSGEGSPTEPGEGSPPEPGEGSPPEPGEGSPIGEDGRFFLEQLPPGDHRAEVTWRGGSCSLTISVPPQSPDGPVTDLGALACTPVAAPP